jgi:hypothetical protein
VAGVLASMHLLELNLLCFLSLFFCCWLNEARNYKFAKKEVRETPPPMWRLMRDGRTTYKAFKATSQSSHGSWKYRAIKVTQCDNGNENKEAISMKHLRKCAYLKKTILPIFFSHSISEIFIQLIYIYIKYIYNGRASITNTDRNPKFAKIIQRLLRLLKLEDYRRDHNKIIFIS